MGFWHLWSVLVIHYLGNGNQDSQVAQTCFWPNYNFQKFLKAVVLTEDVFVMRLLGVVVSWAPGVSKLKMSRFFNERNDGTAAKNYTSQQSLGLLLH